MIVAELTKAHEGTRLRVTGVAPSESERLGHVDDTPRLMGATGTLVSANIAAGGCLQATVKWDDAKQGTLMLMHNDSVELIGGSTSNEK